MLGVGIGVGLQHLSQSRLASLADLQRLFLPADTAALFDFNSALYADAAGTTPAVTGGPVGLRLDASGAIKTPVATSISSYTTIRGGGSLGSSMSFSTSGAGGVEFASQCEIGKQYKIVFEYSKSGSVALSVNNVSGVQSNTLFNSFDATATKTIFFTAVQPNIYLRLSGTGAISFTKYEITPVSFASQGTTALCPIARRTPQTNRLWLEAPDADDALNMTFAAAPGTMYVGCGTAEGVEWSTETWGTTVNTVRHGRFNSWLIARSREFTASEKALIESYYRRVLPQLGPELLTAGDQEGATTWTAIGALSENASSSAIVYSGAKSRKLAGTGTSNGAFFGQLLPVVAGEKYIISARLYCSVGAATLGRYQGYLAHFGKTTTKTGEWELVTYIATGATTATNELLKVNCGATASEIYVDNLSARQIL
jgi:hypothetical protein